MKISAIPRWLKWGLAIVLSFLLLIVIVWLGIAAYVSTHKKPLLKQLTDQLSEHINGTIIISDIEPTLIRGFPGISVALKNVVLRDSSWANHKHDLLSSRYIYVSVNAFSLLRMKPRIREITIADGNIYLFTDSNGYTNTNVFYKKTESNKSKRNPRINHLYFERVKFVFENKAKAKLFRFDIKKLGVSVFYKPSGWDAKAGIHARLMDMCFNTTKGSFLKNKQVTANLRATYDRVKEELSIPQQKIRIDNEYVKAGGTFWVKQTPVLFLLNIGSDGITFPVAATLVTPAIAAKAGIIDFKGPVSLAVSIKGSMRYHDTPQVHMSFNTVNNTLSIPGGQIEKCSFSGFYNNHIDSTGGHGDINSLISVYHLSGSWIGIPFTADTISLTNLSRPVLYGRFVSHFDLQKLNNVGGNTFDFRKGAATINLLYKGGIYNNDTTPSFIKGTINVRDATVAYTPRNLVIDNSHFTLRFTGDDLFVDNMKLQTGKNILLMEGSMKNFANLYYTNPEKILLDWSIRSNELYLEDFLSFLPKRRKAAVATVTKHTSKIHKVAMQLDRMLDLGNVHMSVAVSKAYYRRFRASDIAAEVMLSENGLAVRKAVVNNAGGHVVVNADVDQRGNVNKFMLNADIAHVNIHDFFYQCGNFGQQAITDTNLRGLLDANAVISGGVSDSGKILPGSLNGKITFKLQNAALLNFQPLNTIGKYVFRNREMNNVTIKSLSGSMVLAAGKFTIAPMHIESSALTLNVDGIYSLGKGTDINIDIPLRNPEKDKEIINDSIRAEYSNKGIVVHLKATDGDNGNVKIKWLLRSATEKAERKKRRDNRRDKHNGNK